MLPRVSHDIIFRDKNCPGFAGVGLNCVMRRITFPWWQSAVKIVSVIYQNSAADS